MKSLVCSLSIAALFVTSAAIAVEPEVEQNIKQGLSKIIPGLEVDTINETAVPDLYQVTMGADVLYVSADGRFVLTGELYDIDNKENLTSIEKSRVRKAMLAEIPVNEVIEFAPAKPQHAIYVFTDITCGYCRRLHQDVPILNENGIAVRYLAYPRGGPNSTGARLLQDVWCAKDQNKAMTEAKSGNEPQDRDCDNPVARHYKLGGALGVRGTPAIFLEDGRMLPGYLPPGELLGQVNGER